MAKLLLIVIIVALVATCVVWNASLAAERQESWVVYYGSSLPAEDFLSYDLVVFDSRNHPSLRPLQNQDKTLLGYLSIGEAENYRSDFDTIKELGVLLHENKHWPGHYIVDIRDPKWAKYLIEEKIPEILHRRFDGVMLDTLDSPLYLEEEDPVKYKGMREGAIKLIHALRMHYPDMKIMLNRGFQALPDIAKQIDMVLAESTMVDSHTDAKNPTFFAENIYEESLKTLWDAQKTAPGLKVYSLDYWIPEDIGPVKKIYSTQRRNGFIPYVSTPDLQKIFAEPR